jgi:hypothetical protein
MMVKSKSVVTLRERLPEVGKKIKVTHSGSGNTPGRIVRLLKDERSFDVNPSKRSREMYLMPAPSK